MPKLPVNARKALDLGARLVVAAVLLWAAVPKVRDPAAFVESIENYHLVGDVIATWTAALLPWVEIVVGVALATNVRARGAAFVAGGMFVVFAAAMAQAIFRDINLDCGCFGSALAAQVTWWSVLRNVVLTLLAAIVAFRGDRFLGESRA